MGKNPKTMWEECREIIRQNITQEQYNALFAYTEYKSYADNRLILSIPSQFIYDMLEKDEYVNLISTTLQRVFGKSIELSYSIKVVNNRDRDSRIEIQSSGQPAVQNGPAVRPANQTSNSRTLSVVLT